MVQVDWTREAVANLDAIRSYIAYFDPGAAERLTARLHAAGQSLADFPGRGRPGGQGTRELATIPPYVLIYEVRDSRVLILAVRHGRRLRPHQ